MASINANGLSKKNITRQLTHRSGMDFLEREWINFIVISEL